jgi:hypothetical protein
MCLCGGPGKLAIPIGGSHFVLGLARISKIPTYYYYYAVFESKEAYQGCQQRWQRQQWRWSFHSERWWLDFLKVLSNMLAVVLVITCKRLESAFWNALSQTNTHGLIPWLLARTRCHWNNGGAGCSIEKCIVALHWNGLGQNNTDVIVHPGARKQIIKYQLRPNIMGWFLVPTIMEA